MGIYYDFALTQSLKRGLVITILASWGCLVFCQRSSPIRTPADKKIHFFRRENIDTLFGLNPKRNRFMPQESREYKCQILNMLQRGIQSNFGNSKEEEILSSRLKNIIQDCPRTDFRAGDLFNQSFIFPGTKWCGQGNAAENYHDLGVFNETDACCRDHDFCDDIIQSGRTKHNLINPYGTTRLHCKCDEDLRQCFRKINSVVSNTVGYIFFSLLQTQCFDFDFPMTGCALWRRGAVRIYCVKYALDEEQPKKWQWFDQEPYF